MDVLNVELEVDELAKVLFIDNVNDSLIYLSLGGIENNKDLFYFCLDIFCKGLVLMFGSSNRVDLESLTLEQFEIVRKKILNAGINVKLNVYEDIEADIIEDGTENLSFEDDDKANAQNKSIINISHIETLPINLSLSEYTFVIRTTKLIYEVSFDLCHNVR